MTLLYIIGGLIIARLLFNYIKSQKESNSLYLKIRKKLDEDLLQAKFSGDWKKRQKINLHLIWLKTLKEVESRDIYGRQKNENEATLLDKLSFEDFKFPLKWKLDDIYCYPFSQEIISAYGKVLAENDYQGMFMPDSILPVPKNYIRKAILFNFDYFNLKKPIYEISDKEKRVENLSSINVYLDMSFIDTGNEDLPKSGLENYRVGNVIKEKLPKYNESEDLKLIDWRTETN